MKRLLAGALTAVFLFSLAGCAELKQLRIETADQKKQIEQLTRDNQNCQASLKKTQDLLSQKDKEAMSLGAALKKKTTEVKEQSDSFSKMQEAMKAELKSKQVALKELEGRLTLTMVESILFDSGKADVRKEGVEALKKVAGVLKGTTDQEVIVAGYTDNVQITGRLVKTYATNWELSAARAISVVKILMAQGVDPKVLSASGYGEYRPVADNGTPEGRSKNRRMEIILMPKKRK